MGIEKLNNNEKYMLLDELFVSMNQEYVRRPAKTIKEFIRSSYYLNAKEECWQTIAEILDGFYKSNKHIGVFMLPPGAGKSYMSSVIAAYEMHKLQCLRNPQEKLKLAKGSNIAIINMSQNGNQAKKVVFGEIKARIDNSPWFNSYCRPNPEKKSELEFQNNCFIIPGNSNETNPFGYNLVVAIMDEVAWWETSENHDPVKNAFETLEKRFSNRYKDSYEWKIILITNPSYFDAYVESLEHRDDIYFIRKPIWEIKPEQFVKERIEWNGYLIPKELEDEAKYNPEMFKRDRLSIPSETLAPWLVNKDILWELCTEEARADKEKILWDKISEIRNQFYMHIDLGITGTAAGLAVVYKEKSIVKPYLIWRVQGTKERPVLLSDIRQVPIGLRAKGINVAKITYDGFQSADSIQILQNLGFQCEHLSVESGAPYDTLKEMIHSNKVRLPIVNKTKIMQDTLKRQKSG